MKKEIDEKKLLWARRGWSGSPEEDTETREPEETEPKESGIIWLQKGRRAADQKGVNA